MDWLNDIPATMTENGRLMLLPEDKEPKSVTDVAPAFKKAAEYMIDNNFPGVLS